VREQSSSHPPGCRPMHPRAPFRWPGRATVPAAHTTEMRISRAVRCSRLVFAPVLLVGTLLGTAGLVAPAAGAGPSAPSGPSGSWTNTFDEEFNGAAVDTTKWEPDRYGQDYGGDTPFNPGSEAAWFNTGNVSVSGGNLHLTIRDEPRTLNGKTYPYSSGVVQTAQHHLFTAGTYLEARINVPVCDGCWPAFWTAAPDVWPPEIDGFEYFDTGGSGADTKPQFNYHPPAGGQTGPTVYGDPAVDYRGSFHTYGLLWDGTQAVPYLDGVAYPSGANSDMTRLDQFLLLNLSVQGGHHPAPGSEMLVDWVRAWSPAPAPAPAPATEVHGAIADHYYGTRVGGPVRTDHYPRAHHPGHHRPVQPLHRWRRWLHLLDPQHRGMVGARCHPRALGVAGLGSRPDRVPHHR